jgi:hypothetical protein
MSVRFGDEYDGELERKDNTQEQAKPSGHTILDADHLDVDEPIRGQEYCLFSFMSPEGIMNCNVRALKFRGAFPTLEKANEKAKELEKTDKYFKIFVGESGKWLDFDPPINKVEREMSSNKEHQKILDAQQKQRMDKINALAGKHKEIVDKKEKGEKERTDEIKKMSVANAEIEKRKEDNKETKETKEVSQNHEDKKKASTVNRLKEKLENIKNKKKLEILETNEVKVIEKTDVKDSDSLSKNIDEFKRKLEERRNKHS